MKKRVKINKLPLPNINIPFPPGRCSVMKKEPLIIIAKENPVNTVSIIREAFVSE